MNLIKKVTLLAMVLLTNSFANALEIGDSAPCVVLDHSQGGQESNHCIRDPQIEGRPVIIEFFSISCSDCLKNLPKIKQLAKDLEGQATVRLVSVDRNKGQVMDYIKQNQIDLEVAFDLERDAKKAYQVVATPTLFVLDQNNVVATKHVGILDAASYAEIINIVDGL